MIKELITKYVQLSMNSVNSSCNIWCLLTVVLLYILLIPQFGNSLQKSHDWSYLVFAQRWPPAACLDLEHGKCNIPKGVDDWIIHGLWPTSEKGYPSFCNSSWPFDIKDLAPIAADLKVKWPNIMEGSTALSFWKHEWTKHGTCAASLPSLDGILDYFRKTLQLHDKFNFYEMLKKCAVVPGDKTYVLKYIERGISLQLNTTIKIFCKSHKKYEYPLLDTVYFCMDKTFNLIDCDIPAEKSCNSTFVVYPPLPNGLSECPVK